MYYSALLMIICLPIALSLTPFLLVSNLWLQILALFVSPIIFVITFVSTCGFFGYVTRKAIIPGTFERCKNDSIYKYRRIYGLAFTAIFYFKPLYWIVLTLPFLKKFTFRMFGYQGSMNFTAYPDCWIRDLRILHFDEGVYLANRATIGTNIVLNKEGQNQILVDGLTFGKKTTIGHLAMVAPGTRIGNFCEIGMSSAVGIRCKIGNKVIVSARTTINHGVILGDEVSIGTCSFIGQKAKIKEKISIPGGTTVPAGLTVSTQAEADDLFLKENISLDNYLKEQITKILNIKVNEVA